MPSELVLNIFKQTLKQFLKIALKIHSKMQSEETLMDIEKREDMKVIISGGGTAGHIYPALAVADVLREQGVEVLFVGAEGKMEMERVPRNGYQIVGLPVAGIQRRLTFDNLLVPFKLLRSMNRARRVIREFGPDVVAGFGGYASAPILRAAQNADLPTVIQEQNSYAGLTNRMLAKRARKICTAYEGLQSVFPEDKIVLTGNPLRGNFEVGSRGEALSHFGLNDSQPVILVMGGSLGTRTLNEAMLKQWSSPMMDGVQIIWQTGRFYEAEMARRVPCARENVKMVAFIERMDYAYAAADVVVCRSGASTVSEIELIGKAVIFVPSPNVAEDHQTKNAMNLVERDAAGICPDAQAPDNLLPMAIELLADTARRERYIRNIRKQGKPDAARDVARIIMNEVRR